MLFNVEQTEGWDISESIGTPELFESEVEQEEGEGGGIIGKIIGWVAGAGRAIWRFTKSLLGGDFNIANLVRRAGGWLVQGASFILNFNWNISPKEIEETMKGHLLNLAGLLGEATGGSIGWTFCGLGGASIVGAINPSVAAAAFEAASEEGKEEIVSYLSSFANSAIQAAAQTGFMYGYASVRRATLKFFNQDARLKEIEEGRAKPWTLNMQFDNFIEWLEGKGFVGQLIAEWTENLKDELFDACGEAIMVISEAIGDALDAAEVREERLNPMRLVEVSY
jgi:hypothetical protein